VSEEKPQEDIAT